MSGARGDRRVVIPVPMQQKPSLWKSLRRNIRHPLRRSADEEDRNPFDDQRNDPRIENHDSPVDSSRIKLDTPCSTAALPSARTLNRTAGQSLPTKPTTSALKPNSIRRSNRLSKISDHGPNASATEKASTRLVTGHGRRTNGRKSRDKTRGGQQELQRIMSDPETTKRDPQQQAYQSPYYKAPYQPQEMVRPYELSYTAPSFDPRGLRAQYHQWDARQYNHAMRMYPQQHLYASRQDARLRYRQPTTDYNKNPYYQHDLSRRYEYQEEAPRNVNYGKTETRKPHTDREKLWHRKQLLKQFDDPCMAPKLTCAGPPEVFAADSGLSSGSLEDETEVSGPWTRTTGRPRKDGERLPGDGVLESTILQTYTDNTMDASTREVQAHNAVFQLSNKVRKEIRHSAEEVGAVFTKATDAILLGNHKSRNSRRKSRSTKEDGDVKYFKCYDSAPGKQSLADGTTDGGDETMVSSVADSSSEEIEMAWPQWRQLTNGTLSFGKHQRQ
mmetsp:Transcript_10506/g.20160  ORF Transcript_10506/g.20160 Transcript_10506/m.20160 type:complete len:500 (-) Transcript_10506:79-1578(-)|eukprot:scaffold8728_cov164-Amphora_coffeaeformis.AAC.10